MSIAKRSIGGLVVVALMPVALAAAVVGTIAASIAWLGNAVDSAAAAILRKIGVVSRGVRTWVFANGDAK